LPTTANRIAILTSTRVANAVVIGSTKGTFHGHHYTPDLATVNYSRGVSLRNFFRKIYLQGSLGCNAGKAIFFGKLYWQAREALAEILNERFVLFT
jgi:hypothetical protein